MTAIRSYAPYEVERLVCVDRSPAGVLVRLRGEHDLATRAAVSATIGVRVALGRDDLVVDLSGVTFMDASTVGVIVEARAALRRRGRDVMLRDASSCARRLMELCGLTALLERPRELAAGDGGKVP